MLHESGEINLLTRELSNILWKDFARKKPLLPKILIFVLINSYLRNYLMFKTCGDLRENVFLCTNITQGGVYIIYCRLFKTPWEFFHQIDGVIFRKLQQHLALSLLFTRCYILQKIYQILFIPVSFYISLLTNFLK